MILTVLIWIAIACNITSTVIQTRMYLRYRARLRGLNTLQDQVEALYMELFERWLAKKEKGGPIIGPPCRPVKPLRH